jgi:hypothetical protein
VLRNADLVTAVVPKLYDYIELNGLPSILSKVDDKDYFEVTSLIHGEKVRRQMVADVASVPSGGSEMLL